MSRCSPWLAAVLGLGLLLPPPGTASRERRFCGQWLELTRPEKHDVLAAAERREARGGEAGSCRAGLRGALELRLDAECRNWSALMDFEVRALVDSLLATCSPG